MATIAECYVRGVSTRRVEGLVEHLGIEGISKSQVSVIAGELDEMVEAFRSRPLDAAAYPSVWLDATYVRCRNGGRIVNVAVVIATGVTDEGKRDIHGLDVFSQEDGSAWTAFLGGLVARGLRGVQLVTSDPHVGLKAAVAAVVAGAGWQRCRTHFMRGADTPSPFEGRGHGRRRHGRAASRGHLRGRERNRGGSALPRHPLRRLDPRGKGDRSGGVRVSRSWWSRARRGSRWRSGAV